ncbi:MAG TPA: hypothetical protein VG052_07375 [Puia sp.]|jgi:hypothetical protein|nr:hypothetical protein [Puia sp.]
MFSCDHLSHPFLQDAGTGQGQRMPANLGEGSAPIDGRQVSDLLNYFAGLAGQINFYQSDGSITDWRPFFQNSLPFLLSKIDTYSADKVKSGMAPAVTLFRRNPDRNGLQLLFLQVYYTAIYPLQQSAGALAGSGLDLETQINTLIKDRLLSPLQDFVRWLNTAVHCWQIQAPDISAIAGNPAWGLTPAALTAYETGFSCTVPSTRSQLLAVQAALSDIVDAFAEVMGLVADGAADLVNDDLYGLLQSNGQANVPPHLALLFSFLDQYLNVLNDLNGLTGEQLDFFFQQVLNLAPGPAIPDQAYAVFSIQKQLPAYTIEAGTSLKAGKDGKGADIYFQLDDDLAVNQAQVAAVQTVFVNRQVKSGGTYIEGVYMAPNAQMADGVSKAFADPATAAWPSLGAKQSLYIPPGATVAIDYPAARLGFILASKVLYLQEGKRKIHIQLACEWNPGQGPCEDGIGFNDVFDLARKSVCTEFVVITPAVLDQAVQVGVSQATALQLKTLYLTDTMHKDPCGKGDPAYLDKYLLWIGCCCPAKEKDPAVNVTPREAIAVEVPVPMAQLPCRDEEEEADCVQTAVDALNNELQAVPGIQDFEIPVLMELLPLQRLFDVQFSGAKGWQAPDYVDMELEQVTTTTAPAAGAGNFLWHIRATIATGSPAIGFYDKTKMGEDFGVSDPLVKVALNNAIGWTPTAAAAGAPSPCIVEPVQTSGQSVSPYEFFRNIILVSKFVIEDSTDKQTEYIHTKIEVTVCGVKTLVVQNDANLMDVNKAFTPFGVKPVIADFDPLSKHGHARASAGKIDGPSFYVGSTEVLLKKWTALHLNLNWQGKPKDFDAYYSSYARSGTFKLNDGYVAGVALLENGAWYPKATEIHLFHKLNSSFPVCCHNRYYYSFHFWPEDFYDAPMEFDPLFTPITKYAAGTQRGFLRLTLERQDFLHKYYSWAMSQALIANAQSGMGHKPSMPNEPWTPTILPGMSIDYTATAMPEDITLVQLYPFDGTSRVVNIGGRPGLMANFCNEGNLYIGLSGLLPGQSLSLLFQLAEATADSETPASGLSWQYLVNNEWKDLRDGFEIVRDTTNGLTRTGLVRIAFPDDISNANTILPAGNFWISALMPANTAATSRSIGIVTQAGLATYAPVAGVNDPLRSATPLAANSIAKLTQPDANVLKVVQPYASFGGSAPEDSGNAYPIRVSEQLRHKGRAIQKWDFERLVLQQFPLLSRAKCINHSYYLDSNSFKYDFPMTPANILVAVLPDTNQLSVADMQRPTVPTSMLSDIQDFLAAVQSPFVKVTAANPRYEPVTICVQVVLEDNENAKVCEALLQQEIRTFLSPWMGGDMDQFQFAQRLYLSDIASLIAQQDYVAYLKFLNMSHAEEEMPSQPPDHIDPRTPRSILIAGDINILS